MWLWCCIYLQCVGESHRCFSLKCFNRVCAVCVIVCTVDSRLSGCWLELNSKEVNTVWNSRNVSVSTMQYFLLSIVELLQQNNACMLQFGVWHLEWWLLVFTICWQHSRTYCRCQCAVLWENCFIRLLIWCVKFFLFFHSIGWLLMHTPVLTAIFQVNLD